MQVAVLGLGKFGYKVATSLNEKGAEVIAVDKDIKLVEAIKDKVTHAICLDSTDEKALRAAGIHEVDVAVVSMGEDIEISIMTTAILRRLGVRKIIARGITEIQGEILKEVGATKVIFLEDQIGEQIARSIVAPNIYERVELATGHSMIDLKPKKSFIGKTLRDLNIRANYGVNVIAIKRKIPIITEEGGSSFKTEINDLPGPKDVIREGDILIVVGSDEKINALLEETE